MGLILIVSDREAIMTLIVITVEEVEDEEDKDETSTGMMLVRLFVNGSLRI